ncbi:hypothetical protein DL93DRAFT_1735871 [Clavulina sp. PMI_390]|nr:hypothetical protein DL93DRAFT_1735871 [Clavulina sp. PMI_390]
MAFIEKVIDVIGPDESVPDSTLRELFSPVGEITSVTRWSSTGQKHHVFLLFKTSQMASRALSVPLKGPGRDWRMSRLNPDLKGRVMDLLPKYLQVREKAEDLAVPPPGRPPPLPPGPGSSSSGGIRALNDSWPQSLPPNPSMSQGGPLEIPLWSGHRAPGPYDTVPYGEPPPWDSSWGPPHSSGYASSGPSPYPYDIYGHENPPGAPLRDLSYPLDSIGGQTSYSSGPPSIYRPPSPPPGQYAPSSGYRLPSPPPGHYAHTSPHNGSFRSLPPKPSSETIDARDGTMRYPPRASIPPETRERDPRDADRYPARKNSSPGPPRASARGQKAASRRDSRLDDKSRDWNYPPRGDRSRSRSPEGLRSPSRTLRDSRALPNGRDPRTNDFRRPRDIPRAMSPGQLSSASMEPGNSNTKAGSDDPLPTDSRAVSLALAAKDAPINVWMNLVSRYRRGADLDSADQVSQAAIGCKLHQNSSLNLLKCSMKRRLLKKDAKHPRNR